MAQRKTTKTTKAKRTTRSAKTRAASTENFMTFRLTIQTIYWLLIGGAVVALALWVTSLQLRINRIYDSIEQNSVDSVPSQIERQHKTTNPAPNPDPAQ